MAVVALALATFLAAPLGMFGPATASAAVLTAPESGGTCLPSLHDFTTWLNCGQELSGATSGQTAVCHVAFSNDTVTLSGAAYRTMEIGCWFTRSDVTEMSFTINDAAGRMCANELVGFNGSDLAENLAAGQHIIPGFGTVNVPAAGGGTTPAPGVGGRFLVPSCAVSEPVVVGGSLVGSGVFTGTNASGLGFAGRVDMWAWTDNVTQCDTASGPPPATAQYCAQVPNWSLSAPSASIAGPSTVQITSHWKSGAAPDCQRLQLTLEDSTGASITVPGIGAVSGWPAFASCPTVAGNWDNNFSAAVALPTGVTAYHAVLSTWTTVTGPGVTVATWDASDAPSETPTPTPTLSDPPVTTDSSGPVTDTGCHWYNVACWMCDLFCIDTSSVQGAATGIEDAWNRSAPGVAVTSVGQVISPLFSFTPSNDCNGPAVDLSGLNAGVQHPFATCSTGTQEVVAFAFPILTGLIYLGAFIVGIRQITKVLGMGAPPVAT